MLGMHFKEEYIRSTVMSLTLIFACQFFQYLTETLYVGGERIYPSGLEKT